MNEDQKERCENELGDGKHEVVSTKLIRFQEDESPRETKVRFDEAGCDILSAVDDSKYDDYDLGSQYTWSDDEHSDMEGFGLSIYDSILAIRKEASKIDAVMAVEQLDALKAEIRNMRRELSDRSSEIEELQTLLQLKDDRIGTLELERDLYKADTNKLANDLESCLVKLRRVGGTLADPVSDSQKHDAMPEEPITVGKHPAPSSRVGLAELSTHSGGITSDRSKWRLDPPSCAVSLQTTTSHTSATASITSRSVITPAPIPVIEKPRIATGATRTRSIRVASRPQTKGKVFSLCGSASQKQGKRPERHSMDPEPRGILQEQVQEMSQRLISALATSEELRRRLALLSRYYENIVSQLRDSLVETKTDCAQIEFDLTRQLSTMDRENRSARAEIEMKIREQEEELEIFRAQCAVTISDV